MTAAASVPPVPNEERCKRLTDLIVSVAQGAGYTREEFAVVVAALYQSALQGALGDGAHAATVMMDRCMKEGRS